MDDQTTMSGTEESVQGLRENLSGLAHDAVSLAELQVQLLSVDLREARGGAGRALAAMAVGVILLLGCIPVLMLAGAHALIDVLRWPPWAAYAVVAVVSGVLAAVLLYVGWSGLFRSFKTIGRSRAEFGETLRWLKNSLKAAASRPARRRTSPRFASSRL